MAPSSNSPDDSADEATRISISPSRVDPLGDDPLPGAESTGRPQLSQYPAATVAPAMEEATLPPVTRQPIRDAVSDDETRVSRASLPTQTIPPSGQVSTIGVGSLLAHTYVIEAFIARGGMGEVYKARHQELGSMHAIKVILPELTSDAGIVRLFTEEAKKLRRVRQDAIVAYEGLVLDESGRRFLVMEFVDGPSLKDLLKSGGKLTVPEVRKLRDRLAAGLHAAHDKGIYHRDLSPDNVILVDGKTDKAKVIDFGIAKSTEPGDATVVGGEFAGKYSWAAPEQLGLYGGKVDARTDIYSLGLILGAAASGETLTPASTMAQMIGARQKVPDLSSVPAEFRAELIPLLQPDPAKRPATMLDLPRIIDKKNSILPIAIAGAVFIVAIAGGGFWYMGKSKPAAPPARIAASSEPAAPSAASVEKSAAAAPKAPGDLALGAAQAVIAGLDCAKVDAVRANDPTGLSLSGFVGTSADKTRLLSATSQAAPMATVADKIEIVPWPFCAARRLVPSGTGDEDIQIEPDHASNSYKIGEAVRVTVTPPAGMQGWMSVDLIDAQGDVGHMLPNSEQDGAFSGAKAIKVGAATGHKGAWEAQPPAGPVMLLVTLHKNQIGVPSERGEDAHDYIPRLREDVKSSGDDATIRYQMIDVTE